jgi:hypothetical protein
MEKGSTTDKLSTCAVHTSPVPTPVPTPERAPATTTTSTTGVSAGATPPPGEFYKPAQNKDSGLLANDDVAYAEAYVVRPPAPDVVVVTGNAPTHAPGDHPSPWPAPGNDVRYCSMCIGVGIADTPTVVNHLPGGNTDYGCRADQATRVDTAGDYTYVIGTEAQRAAIAQVPDVTFVPFSTSQATSVYILLLRDLLVSSRFTYSVQNITTMLSPAAATAAIGPYYPTVSACPLATLAAKGVQGC